MEWRNAGKRTKIGPVDASILIPLILVIVFFSWTTTIFLALYAATSIYITWRGLSMSWILRRFRFALRGGVVLAMTPSYWRKLNG